MSGKNALNNRHDDFCESGIRVCSESVDFVDSDSDSEKNTDADSDSDSAALAVVHFDAGPQNCVIDESQPAEYRPVVAHGREPPEVSC